MKKTKFYSFLAKDISCASDFSQVLKIGSGGGIVLQVYKSTSWGLILRAGEEVK